MEKEDIKKDFSYKECEILIRISMLNDIKDMNLMKLANEINIQQYNPIFNKVKNYLITNNIIVITKVIGTNKIIKIMKKKLRDLIDEQKNILLYYNYLNKYHICKW